MASRAVDMSPAAVSRRLEELAQLYEMALSLKRARVVGPLRGAVDQGVPPVAVRDEPAGR
ncbi:MAG: hypothetical protein Q8S73_04185 [Deltaproteobacteria bacterium]|nr:hypothetical protein [Myxococcales bacterium]MDP3213277.1 hypothetical protein [Deltaproteobacteria bacterium]